MEHNPFDPFTFRPTPPDLVELSIDLTLPPEATALVTVKRGSTYMPDLVHTLPEQGFLTTVVLRMGLYPLHKPILFPPNSLYPLGTVVERIWYGWGEWFGHQEVLWCNEPDLGNPKVHAYLAKCTRAKWESKN